MNLRQFLSILLARKWLMACTIVSTMAVAAIVTAVLPPRYTATASIVIDFRTLDPVSGNILPVALLPGYLATQLDIISSRNVALKAVDRLKLAEDPSAQEAFAAAAGGKGSIRHWLAESLLKSVKLDPSRESSMVNINYRSSDPEHAAAVVNAIVQSYIDTTLDLKVEPARQTAVFFDEQLLVLKESLHTSQKKLSAFQREQGITASDERYDVENARLAELSNQVVTAQTQAIDSVSRRDAMARSGSAEALAESLGNPVIQSIKNSLAQAETKLGEVSGRVGPNHPLYQSARTEVDELKRKLSDEMSVIGRSVHTSSSIAAQREGSLRSQLAAQRGRVLEIKKQRDEAALLVRDVENAQRAYDTAMSRFMQTRLESQSNQTNISVVNPAVAPAQPSFPKLPLNMAFAAVVGATLAIGLALIAEMLDRIVRCEEDVVQALSAPILGRILPGPGDQGPAQFLPGARGLRQLPQG